MKAVRHLAHEIEYKVRDFQVGEEIVEIKQLLGVYEDGCVHVAKIRQNCHSDDRREEESRNHKVGVTEIFRYTTFRSE